MQPTPLPPDQNGINTLAQNVVKALREEHHALTRLSLHFDHHLDALRRQNQAELDDATQEVNQEVSTLDRLRSQRERQMRLMGRLLKLDTEKPSLQHLTRTLRNHEALTPVAEELEALHTQVNTQAKDAQKRCERLEFALKYAIRLGREMIQTIQHLDDPPPKALYTSSGNATNPRPLRSFLNKMG